MADRGRCEGRPAGDPRQRQRGGGSRLEAEYPINKSAKARHSRYTVYHGDTNPFFPIPPSTLRQTVLENSPFPPP
jgi:hypothetical protein